VEARPDHDAVSEPMWAAAARALAGGRLTRPTWERTVRDPEVYEMDLQEAAVFDEEEPERGRRGYR
jgi:hypothetical protein